MGSLHAIELASGEFVPTLNDQIAIHFQSNCYPPIPQIMIPVAIEAIQAVNDEDFDRVIDLPEGVNFRNATTIKACQAVDALYLNAWVFVTTEWREHHD
jgi:hypothetical protein